jgi:hypothetical protein
LRRNYGDRHAFSVSASDFGIASISTGYQVDYFVNTAGDMLQSINPWATFISDEDTKTLYFDRDGTGNVYAPVAIAFAASGFGSNYWLDIVITT